MYISNLTYDDIARHWAFSSIALFDFFEKWLFGWRSFLALQCLAGCTFPLLSTHHLELSPHTKGISSLSNYPLRTTPTFKQSHFCNSSAFYRQWGRETQFYHYLWFVSRIPRLTHYLHASFLSLSRRSWDPRDHSYPMIRNWRLSFILSTIFGTRYC